MPMTLPQLADAIAPALDAIDARHGTFGILGNHDAAEIAFALERIGVRMLVNEALPVGPVEAPLWLAGVDDPFDCSEHPLSHAFVECANVQFDEGLVRDDVFLGASLQRAYRHDG